MAEELIHKLSEFESEVNSSEKTMNNVKRRIIYSDLELLKLDFIEKISNNIVNNFDVDDTFLRIDLLTAKLNLVPLQRKTHWLETCIRVLGVSSSFVLVGVFWLVILLIILH